MKVSHMSHCFWLNCIGSPLNSECTLSNQHLTWKECNKKTQVHGKKTTKVNNTSENNTIETNVDGEQGKAQQ